MCGNISPDGKFLFHWLGQLSFLQFLVSCRGYCSTTCGTVAIQVVTVFNKPSWEIRLGHTMSHTVMHIWDHLSKLIRQRKGWHWRGTSPPMPGGMFVKDAHITLNYPFSKNLAHAKKCWPQKTETLWILWALVEAHDWQKFPCTDVKQYQPQQKRFETNKGKPFFHHHLAKPLHFAVLIVDSYKSAIKWLNKGDIQCVMTWLYSPFSVWKDASDRFEKNKVKIANRGNLCMATVDGLHPGVTSQGEPLVFCHDRSTG